MGKNVLVISTSLRDRSNSEMLADAFLAGTKAAGNRVEKVTLREKALSFCKGCLTCQETQKCVIQDDTAQIVEKMRFPKKLRKHLKDILPLHVLVWTTVNRVFTSPATVM